MMDNMKEQISRSERMQAANESIPKDISEKVNQIIEEEFPDADRIFGICHSIWQRKKELYKELGYEWYAPTDIYPGVMFD